MVDTRANLIAAVLAAPDDDTPRLVYADWLEENGESERAEFIRLQIDLALWGNQYKRPRAYGNWHVDCRSNNGGTDDKCRRPWYGQGVNAMCEYHQLKQKADTVNKQLWGMIPGGSVTWSRGFIVSISAPLAALLEHGPAIVRENPVREVTVTEPRPMMFRYTGGVWEYFNSDLDGLGLDPRKQFILSGWGGTYRSEQEAVEALSAAVLRVLRERSNQKEVSHAHS